MAQRKYQISRTHLIGYLVEDGITSSVHAKHTFSRISIMLRFAFCFRSCIILVHTPPLGTKGGWREGRDPPGLLRRQPHASIRKLESTPTPTGNVEILTPASNMGLALLTNTSLRPPPPTSRYTWDTPIPPLFFLLPSYRPHCRSCTG